MLATCWFLKLVLKMKVPDSTAKNLPNLTCEHAQLELITGVAVSKYFRFGLFLLPVYAKIQEKCDQS